MKTFISWPVHCLLVAINCVHIACIIYENEYYKRLTIKGLQVFICQKFTIFGSWSGVISHRSLVKGVDSKMKLKMQTLESILGPSKGYGTQVKACGALFENAFSCEFSLRLFLCAGLKKFSSLVENDKKHKSNLCMLKKKSKFIRINFN